VRATQTNKLLPNSILDSTENLEFHFGSAVIWGPYWHCIAEVHPQVVCLVIHTTQEFQFCFYIAVKIFVFPVRIKVSSGENTNCTVRYQQNSFVSISVSFTCQNFITDYSYSFSIYLMIRASHRLSGWLCCYVNTR
jgi:hypothetical protein